MATLPAVLGLQALRQQEVLAQETEVLRVRAAREQALDRDHTQAVLVQDQDLGPQAAAPAALAILAVDRLTQDQVLALDRSPAAARVLDLVVPAAALPEDLAAGLAPADQEALGADPVGLAHRAVLEVRDPVVPEVQVDQAPVGLTAVAAVAEEEAGHAPMAPRCCLLMVALALIS